MTLQDTVNRALENAFANGYRAELERQTYNAIAQDLLDYDADVESSPELDRESEYGAVDDVEACVRNFFEALR